MTGWLKALAEKTILSFRDRMLKEGWQTNGVYWWFEDTEQMTFHDALELWKGYALRKPLAATKEKI